MTLGNLIKNYRKEHSLSQQAFADMAGLSKAYISILERNFNPVNKKHPIPSVITIKSVATAMNADFNDIIAILDPDTQVSISAEDQLSSNILPQIDASEENLLEKYRNLDGYGKEVVDLVLDAEHRRVSEQQDTVEFAARSGQRGKVRRVDNLDDLLPPADEDPSHI